MDDEKLDDMTQGPQNPLKGTGSNVAGKAAGKAKDAAAKKAKQAIKKGAKKAGQATAKAASSAASAVGSASSIAAFFATPVGWVVLAIILIILIIILVIGFIGFFATMPGLTKEKISQFYEKTIKNLYTSSSTTPEVEVDDDEKVALANYIDELGYDVIGYGFLDRITRDDEKKIKTITPSNKDYIYAYILANERTYAFSEYDETTWNQFIDELKSIFLPGFLYGRVVNALLPEKEELHKEAKKGMLDVGGWASGLTGEIFDAMYIERDENNSQNNRLIVKRWRVSDNVKWWNPFSWGGIFNTDTFSWSLAGWTPRYGKPIELSLALHLSTMAPDFAYDFCMDDDLQSFVKIDTRSVTYNVKYKYTTEDGITLTADGNDEIKGINQVYDELVREMETIEYLQAVDYEDKIVRDNGSNYYCPIECFDNVSVINTYNSQDSNVNNKWVKAIDNDGNIVSFFDGNGNPEFADNGYWIGDDGFIERTDNSDLMAKGGPVSFGNSNTEMSGEIRVLSLQDCIDLLSRGSLEYSEESLIKETFSRMEETARYTIDEFIIALGDRVDWRIKGYINEGYGNGYGDLFDYLHYCMDQGYYDELRALLPGIKDSINQDISAGKDVYIDYVIEKSEELQDWKISFETLTALHTIFNDEEETSKTLKTYQPYISYVRNHWYKDVLFEPDKYVQKMEEELGKTVSQETKDAIAELDAAGKKNAYEYKNKDTITMPFNPEGVAADALGDENLINIINSTGQMSVDLTPQEGDSQVVQVRQPLVTSNEAHHWKLKNWLQHGYFFIYDGNQSTAEKIKDAKKFLYDRGYYDSEYPLFEDILGIDGGSSTVDIDAIDEQAKKANEALIRNGYKVQLKKINFAKDTSLAAFSILESVHSKDAEYVYRDLKELLIELKYFSRSDFASIEMGALDWILPEYIPQEWPMKKYEKTDDNYETLILSKASVDKLKAEIGESGSEDFDPTAPTEPNGTTKKITSEGFSGTLKVIAPEKCKVLKIEDGSNGGQAVTLKFKSANKVKNFTLKIDGITTDVAKGDSLNKGDLLGYTIDGTDIKLLLKDNIKAVVNNIEDYMNPKRRKYGINADYAKLFFTVYEGGKYEGEDTGPDNRGMRDSDNEEAFGICQWTLTKSDKGDYLTEFLQGMYKMDPAFCRELNAYIGLDFDELWNKAEDIHETLKKLAKNDRQYLAELEMTYALETLYKNEFVTGKSSWILDKRDPVVGTYLSLVNWKPGFDWEEKAGINKNMSDEEIIKRLAAAMVKEGGNDYKDRMESQARLAVDMLTDDSISPKNFCYKGCTGDYYKYRNGGNSGYLDSYLK